MSGNDDFEEKLIEQITELFRNMGMKLDKKQIRALMEQFRSSGMETSGPKPINSKDTQAFANQLDRIVTRIFKTKK